MASNKGAAYERVFSKQLSLWVSDGLRDDIFWRSPGSGGWASRKTTASQGSGDIVALDAMGKELLSKTTIELKCGYNKDFPRCFHCLDKPTILDDFIEQAKSQADKAMTDYWWLVWKMDRVKPLLFCPVNSFSLPRTLFNEEDKTNIYGEDVLMMQLATLFGIPYSLLTWEPSA